MFTSVKHNLLQKLFKVQTLIVLNKRRFLRFNRFDLIIGTSSIVCGAGSVQLSGVRPSVRPSVCLSVRLSYPATARRSCEFAAAGPAAARRYRSILRLTAIVWKCVVLAGVWREQRRQHGSLPLPQRAVRSALRALSPDTLETPHRHASRPRRLSSDRSVVHSSTPTQLN